ncbi:MAG: protein kinase [Myxococcota bacterium]|nr:protein kinase [Myxococcota bacterium]
MTDQYPTVSRGRYVVTKCIGSGGMGAVFRCFDTVLKVDRALKVLRPELVTRTETRARFTREAVSMASLNHPNIVQVYDYGEEALTLFIVMEYLPYDSVRRYLEHAGVMRPELAANVCLQAGIGLQFMHDKGVFHRDIKPGNLLIADNTIKVGDFGLVKGDFDQLQTQTDAVMGTFAFMSPEQRLGTRTVNHQTDIYALAATLFNCLTGTISVDLHQREERAQLLAGIEPGLVHILERGLQGAQSERYASISEMLSDLEAFLNDTSRRPTDDFTQLGLKVDTATQDSEQIQRIWAQFTSQEGVTTDRMVVDGLESTIAPEDLAEPTSVPQLPATRSEPDAPNGGYEQPSTVDLAEKQDSPQNTPSSRQPPLIAGLVLAVLALLSALILQSPDTIQAPADTTTPDDSPRTHVLPSGTSEPNEHTSQPGEQPKQPAEASEMERAERALLSGNYIVASHHLQNIRTNSGLSAPLLAKQWLVDSLRWQSFGATWESLILITARDQESTDAAKDGLLTLLLASRQRALSISELEQRWTQAQKDHPGAVTALMYLVTMVQPTDDRYLVKLKSYQAAYPNAVVFRHLELRAAIYRKQPNVPLQDIETADDNPNTPPALLLDYSLRHLRLGESALAERSLKRLIKNTPDYTEARLALANLYADRSKEHLRVRQFLMAVADTVPARDQAAFLAYHGKHLAQQGRLSEAIKLWNFCVRDTDGDGDAQKRMSETRVHPMQVSCLQQALFSTVWFEQMNEARSTIDKSQRVSALLTLDRYTQRELAMATVEARAFVSLIEERDRASFDRFREQFTLLAAEQPQSQAAIDGTARLAQIELRDSAEPRIIEALTTRAKTPMKYRTCRALYDDTVLLGHLSSPTAERVMPLLRAVIDGKCIQTATYAYVQGRARIELADRHLQSGNRREAQTVLDAFSKTHASADENVPDIRRAEALKRKL